MISVIQKWKISIVLIGGKQIDICISNNYYNNVLRNLSEIEFGDIKELKITKVVEEHNQMLQNFGIGLSING